MLRDGVVFHGAIAWEDLVKSTKLLLGRYLGKFSKRVFHDDELKSYSCSRVDGRI